MSQWRSAWAVSIGALVCASAAACSGTIVDDDEALTPVPAPATGATLLAGCFAAARRRR